MEKEITKEDWDWKCPMCGAEEEDWEGYDHDYDLRIRGSISFGQKFTCEKCDATITVFYDGTLAGVRLLVRESEGVRDSSPNVDNRLTDKKMASIRHLLGRDKPDEGDKSPTK